MVNNPFKSFNCNISQNENMAAKIYNITNISLKTFIIHSVRIIRVKLSISFSLFRFFFSNSLQFFNMILPLPLLLLFKLDWRANVNFETFLSPSSLLGKRSKSKSPSLETWTKTVNIILFRFCHLVK